MPDDTIHFDSLSYHDVIELVRTLEKIRGVRCPDQETATALVEVLNEHQPGQWFAYKSDYAIDPWVARKLPQIGDAVSRGFNGDYYPCGTIRSVSPNGKKIVTTTGHQFFRHVKNAPNSWKLRGSCFHLVNGTIDRTNPEF